MEWLTTLKMAQEASICHAIICQIEVTSIHTSVWMNRPACQVTTCMLEGNRGYVLMIFGQTLLPSTAAL